MSLFVAFLRGINVGGKNSLPMHELVPLFEELGCKEVRTYIQSGNVVFEANEALGRRVPDAVTRAIAKSTKLTIPVVTRTAAELVKNLRDNPYLRTKADPSRLYVAFLAEKPAAAQIAALDPKRSPGDEFVVKGRDVYLHLPNGVGKTKLTNAYLDAKLGTVSTLRNLATIQKLAAMCDR